MIRFKQNQGKHHFAVVFSFLFLATCQNGPKQELLTFEGQTMGTTYHVKVVAQRGQPISQTDLQVGIQAQLDRVDQLMSNWKADSEVSHFNAAGTEPVRLGVETLTVMREAAEIWQQTQGVFDPTLSPLIDLWGFGPQKHDAFPTQAEIDLARGEIGYDKVVIGENSAQKTNPKLTINLSAIAKGYGVDQVAQYLEAQGLDRYMVEVGGEMRVLGHNIQNHAWRIGIESPSAATNERTVFAIIERAEGAIASSGDYRNHFEHEGKWYSHIINPKTGWPIEPKVAATSVIADRCSTADALATAFMVMAPEDSLALAQKMGVECLIILRNPESNSLETLYTPRFRSFVLEGL
ncbi:MAG: FAD:protein FMN transferase [Acidobacteria bacterium]|nr:FAD:protein FMN transferase [Acidobacteriota bacterium]